MSLAPSTSNPGQLDSRIQLSYPLTSRDTDGGAPISYVSAGSYWAQRDPTGGGRLYAADAKHYETVRTYRIRYNESVEAGWRLTHGTFVFEVVSALPVGRKDYMDLACRTIESEEGSNVAKIADYHSSSNASGNTNIALGSTCISFVESTSVSGVGSTTRTFALLTTNVTEGAHLSHRLTMPETAGITLEWHNASAAGSLLTSYVSDGIGDDVVAEFVFTGSAWTFLRFTAPANA